MHRRRYFVWSAGVTRAGNVDLGSLSVDDQDRASDRGNSGILPLKHVLLCEGRWCLW